MKFERVCGRKYVFHIYIENMNPIPKISLSHFETRQEEEIQLKNSKSYTKTATLEFAPCIQIAWHVYLLQYRKQMCVKRYITMKKATRTFAKKKFFYLIMNYLILEASYLYFFTRSTLYLHQDPCYPFTPFFVFQIACQF